MGLLNIGVEPSKGTSLQTTVYPLLQEAAAQGRINFVGNVEAREAVEGAVDVIVSDGYSGNIFLKTMEGTGLFMARELKKMFKKNALTMLAAALVSGGLKDFKKLMSADEVGGTALVGISKPVIKAPRLLQRPGHPERRPPGQPVRLLRHHREHRREHRPDAPGRRPGEGRIRLERYSARLLRGGR